MSQEVNMQREVKNLKENLQEMPKAMSAFSQSMRSLYAENAVGSNEKAAIEFRKLRDDTRNDALVYLKGILPLSTNFVASISEYFEYYEALEYDEWKENLKDVLEEVVGYQQLCKTLVKMHEKMIEPLKKRQSEALLAVRGLKELQSSKLQKTEDEPKMKEDNAKGQHPAVEGDASSNSSPSAEEELANAVAMDAEAKDKCKFEKKEAKPMNKEDNAKGQNPPVKRNASSNSSPSAEEELANAVARDAEAKIQKAASDIVSDTLIPALQKLIEGLSAAAGFFSVVEKELKSFLEKSEKSLENRMQSAHYKMMNEEAKQVKALCQRFYAVLPSVRTDFDAIPKEGTDQNYVDRWLEEQKKIIRETCARSVAASMLKAITR